MGCANSKQKRCRHCSAPYSPVPRSYSVHVHHPPQSKEDSYHVVGLTSTTLGSLMDLSHKVFENDDQNGFVFSNASFLQENEEESDVNTEFPNGVVIEEPKRWSNEMKMEMDQKKIPEIIIPKTPLTTPPGEPETINTWELMEGLEDTTSPFHHHHYRSFSFDVHHHNPRKPMWLHMTEDDDDESNSKIDSDFDPEVISSFNKSLQEISPGTPFHLRTAYNGKESGIKARKGLSFEPKKIHGKEEDKVVLYFTSLRGIRKTYEDCCHVRMILKGVGVRVDERDVSMHTGFKEELKELLGDGFYWGGLPRVFLGKHYIGGVEEIRKLHEDGQLEKLLDCCEKIDDNGGGECEGCGDIRFVPCDTCSGSCKIYYEEEEDDDDDEVGDYGFQRCPDCNENGLIRCPICC